MPNTRSKKKFEKAKATKRAKLTSKKFEKSSDKSNGYPAIIKTKWPPWPPVVKEYWWLAYRKEDHLGERQKIFCYSNPRNNYEPLINELIARGWHYNNDPDSEVFHLKFLIRAFQPREIRDIKSW